jgi:hypothetical protein
LIVTEHEAFLLPSLFLPLVLVRFDHIASFIISANHCTV